jgi:hypothetical protein
VQGGVHEHVHVDDALEEALKIKEAHGGEVTVLTMGPAHATESIRKALAMGPDKAVHVEDDALHGSCAAHRQRAAVPVVQGHHGRREEAGAGRHVVGDLFTVLPQAAGEIRKRR